MKKISIYTLYDKPNFGCYLQAFAMQTFLNNQNFQTSFCIPKAITLKSKLQFQFQITKYKILDLIKVLIRKRIFFKKIDKNFYYLKNKELNKSLKLLNIEERGKLFDCAIIGSDEIWNLGNTSFFPFLEFFGIGIKAKKKIAYAPSMSGYNVQKLCNDTLRVEGIKQLDYIFPRDSKTKSFVNKILQNNFVTEVVDPTLLLFNWMQYASNFNTPKNYLLFYGYSPSQNVISFIKKFSKENNILVISLDCKHDWADIILPVGPFDFLKLIKDADYVVTDTFHGTLFSIVFNKKFISINNSIKIEMFMKKFKLMSKLYNEKNNSWKNWNLIIKSDKFSDNDLKILTLARKNSQSLLINSINK